jgi:signal transduction histidine kinase
MTTGVRAGCDGRVLRSQADAGDGRPRAGGRLGACALGAILVARFGVPPVQAAEATGLSIESLTQNQGLAGVAIFASLVLLTSVTAVLHLTGRKQWTQREASLVADLAESRAKLDRAGVFLSAEPQIVVAWGGASGDPEIAGELSLVTDAPAPRRVLGFGSWLAPEVARRVEAAVDALRKRGEGFRFTVASLAGRHLDLEGRAIGGRAILRIRDVSGDRLELARLRERHGQLVAETTALRAALDLEPAPVWARDKDGKLIFVNAAYARAVEAETPQDAVRRGLELLDKPAREAAEAARARGEAWKARAAVVMAGERCTLDLTEKRVEDMTVGVGVDLSEVEQVKKHLGQQMESHARTLDQLGTAVAIFDRSKRLVFHNAAYRKLWGLDETLLAQQPTDGELLDKLRARGKLPEQADFRGWKAALMAAYTSLETTENAWYLPDGRMLRVVLSPNPQGGVTYLFDDESQRHLLESQYNSVIRVQGETLDSLREGVALFGTDGRLKLSNPALAQIWALDPGTLAQDPHIDDICRAASALAPGDPVWAELRSLVAGLHDARTGFTRRIARADGAVVDLNAAPLPDGATLLTFSDVTAGVNVERALTERNRALTEAETLRNDFVHHVSYELRSPLTHIIGFIELLNDGGVGPLNAKQREYAGYILKSSNALLAIINDILDLATIDTDAMTLSLGEVDIRRTIEAAAEGVQDRLEENEIRLQIVAADDVGAFEADAKRIRQILFNLLSNAIGFSAAGQTVTLAAFRRGEEVVFKVSDQGRGIPPEILDKVFDRFSSHTIGSRHRGVGLGLSIVRSFVERHGGKVLIDSAPGEGTTVTCVFPAAPSARLTEAKAAGARLSQG